MAYHFLKSLERNCFLKSATAKSLIDVLNRKFATFRNSFNIVTDNGPPSPSTELRKFMKKNEITHHCITPIWPRVNCQVENFNKRLMKAIRTAYIEGKDLETEIFKVFRQYRGTPHTVTKEASAHLMFG